MRREVEEGWKKLDWKEEENKRERKEKNNVRRK